MATYFFETITDAQAAGYDRSLDDVLIGVDGSTEQERTLARLFAEEKPPGLVVAYDPERAQLARADALHFGNRGLGDDAIYGLEPEGFWPVSQFGAPPRNLGARSTRRPDKRFNRLTNHRK